MNVKITIEFKDGSKKHAIIDWLDREKVREFAMLATGWLEIGCVVSTEKTSEPLKTWWFSIV